MTQPQPIPGMEPTPPVVTKDTQRLLQFVKERPAAEPARVEVGAGRWARRGRTATRHHDVRLALPCGHPGLLRLYVEDSDRRVRRALAAGATQ